MQSDFISHKTSANPTFIAGELARHVEDPGSEDLVFVARSDDRAKRIFAACIALNPGSKLIYVPAWDCLPYDRVPPSRASMGMRMDALREWLDSPKGGRLCVTSLEAMLQRVPPADVIKSSHFQVAVGEQFDLSSFEIFLKKTGYAVDGVVDEPGEVAILKDVVDIFPAGGALPMRCYLNEGSTVGELWFYDPATQRTQASVETMVFGPASEVIHASIEPEDAFLAQAVPAQLLSRYGSLQTLFDILKPAAFLTEPGVDERVDGYLDIIEDARISTGITSAQRSIYLDRQSWDEARSSLRWSVLDLDGYAPLPSLQTGLTALARYVEDGLADGMSVAVVGDEPRLGRLVKRLSRSLGVEVGSTGVWRDVLEAGPALRSCSIAWTEGYVDRRRNLFVVTCQDVLGPLTSDLQDVVRPSLRAPDLQIGDVVVHEEHGVAILRAIETTVVDGVEFDSVRLEYNGGASIIVPMRDFGLLWRYGAEPSTVTLDRLHSDAWAKKRGEMQRDILMAAKHLVEVANKRAKTKGKSLSPPQDAYQKFAARFPYSLTPDQRDAIDACLIDIASGRPMDRLVCGDVGYGKTEIALRAAAAVAMSDMQVAVVAPTTVLARQHYDVFKKRFAPFGLEVSLLSRAVSEGEIAGTRDAIKNGTVDIVIATHAILSKDVSFKKLGLVIIDEEHRFGAAEKAAIRSLSPKVHALAMSATPIPRTLQSALIGVQDVSLLKTAPSRRRPVRTSILQADRATIRAALLRERRRGGQSFFVAPRVTDIGPLKAMLGELVPEFEVLVAHGKMSVDKMEDAVVRFSEGNGDILLSTNIIESGLDVPRANTIFVWRPDRFGLAQLHQLRGRVGRGRSQGLAYMLTEPNGEESEDSSSRLQSLLKFDRLGSGAEVAMNDLELRGGGSVTGEEQAGHIKVLGTSLYEDLLANAIRSLHGKEAAAPNLPDFELGVTGYIPSDFIPDPTVRLSIYTRLLKIRQSPEFDELEEELLDRFGDLVQPVVTLLKIGRLRARAAQLGITSVRAGPDGLALESDKQPSGPMIEHWKKSASAKIRGGRVILGVKSEPSERLRLIEGLLDTDGVLHVGRRRHA